MTSSIPRPRSVAGVPRYPRHAVAALVVAAFSVPAACRPPGPPGVPPHVFQEASGADAAADAQPDAAIEGSIEPTVLTEDERRRDQALMALAAEIVDAHGNTNGIFTSLVAQFTTDKKRFVFGSTRSGMPQIYLGDPARPSEAPRLLSPGTERAVWAAITADDKYVLFNRDQGADENWRIYRTRLDGSETTCLTPGDTQHRDEPLLPSGKPDMMIYTTHVKTSPASQLMVQPIAGGEPKQVYHDPLPAYAVDATRDGARVLLIRWNSASDLVLFEVGTAGGGKAQRLYPAEGAKANVNQAAYSADGKLVFVGTDEGKEGFSLLAIDPKSSQVKARWVVDNPPTASIAGIFASPRGDRLLVLVHAGSHTEIRILDAQKLTVQRTVKTPLGEISAGPFTKDGSRFAYWVSTPDRPADLFVADAATGASAPLRIEQRPALDKLAPLTTSIEKARAHDGLEIPMNVYLPKLEPGQKAPVLVMFHGGPSSSSFIKFSPYVRFFSAQGYAVVEPNIRGSTGFGRAYEMGDDRDKRGDALKDMAAVNAWVKAQSWCDPGRVVVYGGSYGGYLTLMAATRQPGLWRAGVDVYGIADLRTFLKSTDQSLRTGFVDEFGDLDKDAALLDQYSPSRDFDKITMPLFVYSGQNDPRVPRNESDQIVRALRQRKIPVEYMVAANEGHSLDRRETRVEFLARVARFLRDHMQ
ncbi:MAG: S9 family peptidase [Deltaproteobacteria bacterium]|nr:S9 family peptidase [Deltaproteobacteria bacterium]